YVGRLTHRHLLQLRLDNSAHNFFVILPHGAFNFRMSFMANQDRFYTFTGIFGHLNMYFSHQWTSRIKDLQTTTFSFLLYRFRNTMCAKNYDIIVRNFVELIDKTRTSLTSI